MEQSNAPPLTAADDWVETLDILWGAANQRKPPLVRCDIEKTPKLTPYQSGFFLIQHFISGVKHLNLPSE